MYLTLTVAIVTSNYIFSMSKSFHTYRNIYISNQYFSGWIKNQLYFSGVYPEQWAQRKSRSTLFQKSTGSPESSSPSHILPSTSCTGNFGRRLLGWWLMILKTMKADKKNVVSYFQITFYPHNNVFARL